MNRGSMKVFWAWMYGCCFGAIVYVWSLTGGTWNLLSYRGLDIHDVQAKALLHGHLAAPKGALSIEAFVVGGKEYSYFGPFPALIRMPILWIAPGLEGRLSILSLLAAYVVVAVGSAWFVCELCPQLSIRGRTDRLTTAALGFAATGGSVLTAAAAAPNHYHESLIWGLGLSLAGLAATLRFLRAPTMGPLLVATALCLAAANARSTTGLAVSVALVLAVTWSWFQGRLRPGRLRTGVLFAAVSTIPGLSIAALNYLKFKMLIGLPMANQVYTGVSEHRRQMLAANGGSYFRLAFVPTNLVQYLRPDFAGFTARFPFFRLPQHDATRIGRLAYDQVDHTSSAWGAAPALAMWAAVAIALILFRPGCRAALRRWRHVSPIKERMGISLFVGALSIVPVAMIGFIGNRYLIDFMPLLLTLGVFGYWLWHRSARRVWIGAAATVLTALLGGAFNSAVAFEQQGTALDPAVVRQQVHTALAVADRGIGASPRIETWKRGIAPGHEGDLMIVGDCAALYRSDGSAASVVNPTNWRPVERSMASGSFSFSIDAQTLRALDRRLDGADEQSSSTPVAGEHGLAILEVTGSDGTAATVSLNHVERTGNGDTIKLQPSIVLDGKTVEGRTVEVDSLPATIDLVADEVLGLVQVTIDERPAVSADFEVAAIKLRPTDAGLLSESDLRGSSMALCHSAKRLRDGA